MQISTCTPNQICFKRTIQILQLEQNYLKIPLKYEILHLSFDTLTSESCSIVFDSL